MNEPTETKPFLCKGCGHKLGESERQKTEWVHVTWLVRQSGVKILGQAIVPCDNCEQIRTWYPTQAAMDKIIAGRHSIDDQDNDQDVPL